MRKLQWKPSKDRDTLPALESLIAILIISAVVVVLLSVLGCKENKISRPSYEGDVLFVKAGSYNTEDQKQLGKILTIFADRAVLKVETDSLIAKKEWGILNIEKKVIDTIRYNINNYGN